MQRLLLAYLTPCGFHLGVQWVSGCLGSIVITIIDIKIQWKSWWHLLLAPRLIGVMAGVIPGVMTGVMPEVMPGVMPGVMTGAMTEVIRGVMTGATTGVMTGVMPEVMPKIMTGAMPGVIMHGSIIITVFVMPTAWAAALSTVLPTKH